MKPLAKERWRIREENRRREGLCRIDPAEQFFIASRRVRAKKLLQTAGCFSQQPRLCVEIGCGRRGWLADLRSWGLGQQKVFGFDIDLRRLSEAKSELPEFFLVGADGAELPLREECVDLVVISTVFTSILDGGVRQQFAAEIERVLRPNGSLLWYDFAFDNPRNPNVKGIRRHELRALFPKLRGRTVSVTLAPPIARTIVPRSERLAAALEKLPCLRTHLLAVLRKSEAGVR